MKTKISLTVALSLATYFTTVGAYAQNELGGVSFQWTETSSTVHRGRFINRNSTCKIVTWTVLSGGTFAFPVETRIAANTSTGDDTVRFTPSGGTNEVRISNVKDC